MTTPKVFLGLPAYNEEASIQPLFEKIEQIQNTALNDLMIIFYDDGCIDGTKNEVNQWMNRLSITYLDGGTNKGLGTAMNALLSCFIANSSKNDMLVIMDCDDTHDPAQILQMLDAQRDKRADVVIASRFCHGSFVKGVPFHRVLMSFAAGLLYKIIHPIRDARDYTCGYRLYTHSILQKLAAKYTSPLLKERGFSCMVELLLKVAHVNAKFSEIPLSLRYDNKKTASKMDVSGNAFRSLKKLFAWRIRGLA